MHRHTIRAYLQQYGVYQRFCNISDKDLDILVRTFKSHKPASGLSYVVGFLQRHQVHVQRRRIRASLKRIDGLGQALRNYEAIDRDEYSVPHSNYLWHLDGHHKLIKWGIIIHGMIDGYCHTASPNLLPHTQLSRFQITGLKASNNDRSETVLNLFLDAIKPYGIPSRMRGDRGGENIKVSVWMIKHRGHGRASFMWGL